MNARIDPLRGEIELGERTFRFRLDSRANAAVVRVGESEYRVRPLQWGEKATLSRYASLGDAQMVRELVHLCADLAGGESIGPEAEAVLLELTRWINDPSGYAPGLPFDPDSLAAVTLQLCRATHLRPADFDTRGAWEVEAMWKAVATDMPGESPSRPAETSATTRIVIVPDPAPARAEAPATIESDPPPVVPDQGIETAAHSEAAAAGVTPRFRVVVPADAVTATSRVSPAKTSPLATVTHESAPVGSAATSSARAGAAAAETIRRGIGVEPSPPPAASGLASDVGQAIPVIQEVDAVPLAPITPELVQALPARPTDARLPAASAETISRGMAGEPPSIATSGLAGNVAQPVPIHQAADALALTTVTPGFAHVPSASMPAAPVPMASGETISRGMAVEPPSIVVSGLAGNIAQPVAIHQAADALPLATVTPGSERASSAAMPAAPARATTAEMITREVAIVWPSLTASPPAAHPAQPLRELPVAAAPRYGSFGTGEMKGGIGFAASPISIARGIHAPFERVRLNAVTPLAAAPHECPVPTIDREELFDELADRLAEAAADMGIEV